MKSLRLSAAGRLEVVADAVADEHQPRRLRLRPRLTELSPERGGSTFDDMLRMLAAATVKAALNTLAATMPAFDLPLAREFSLRRPASRHPVDFTLGKAAIAGELRAPAPPEPKAPPSIATGICTR